MQFLPLPEKFIVLDGKAPALSPSLEKEVETIWRSGQATRGQRLFNGTLFSVERISGEAVVGRFIEYRRFFAQTERPSLFPDLQVRPLAVTAILQNTEGIFFGQRNSRAGQQPDCWELVPAGGVDASTLTAQNEVDPKRQILDELEEEVGLSRTLIASCRLVAFNEEPEHHVFDLVWELETVADEATVTVAHAGLSSPEHINIVCVGWSELEDFLGANRTRLAAGNWELIEQLAPHKRNGKQ